MPKVNIRQDIYGRAFVFAGILMIIGILFMLRLVKMRSVDKSHWQAYKNTTKTKIIEGARGTIYDNHSNILVSSVEHFDIIWDARTVHLDTLKKYLPTLCKKLAQFAPQKTAEEYYALMSEAYNKNNRYLRLFKNLNYEEKQYLLSLPIFKLGKNKGGFIEEPNRTRIRTYGDAGARTLGYWRNDTSKVGLEGYYDKFLLGSTEPVEMTKHPSGTWIPKNDIHYEQRNGNDLYTTLDIRAQDLAHHVLKKAVQQHQADHGSVVLMEVKTGKILAMANIATNKKGEYGEFENHAISEAIDPGSTFKLASMLALLNSGKANLDTKVYIDAQQVPFCDHFVRDVKPPIKDTLTLTEAMIYSSNVAFTKLVSQYFGFRGDRNCPQDAEKDRRLSKEFIQLLKATHIDQPTGIDLSGEKATPIKSPDDGKRIWSGISLPWIAYGYELAITPIQILSLYNAIANKGVMMRPYLMEQIKNGTTIIKSSKPQKIATVCDSKTALLITEVLKNVVQEGTAKNLKDAIVPIAGKTGTTQLRGVDKKEYQASFVGFFPADNPQISCIVVINKPQTGSYYGAEVAAPVFKELVEKYYPLVQHQYNRLENRTEPKNYIAAAPPFKTGNRADIQKFFKKHIHSRWEDADTIYGDWIQTTAHSDTLRAETRAIPKTQQYIVPNVVGMGLKDALFLLENQGLRVHFSGVGTIKHQSIQPGTPISNGQNISIRLSPS